MQSHIFEKFALASPLTRAILPSSGTGGVLVSTECLMRWLHVEVDRLASLKAAQNKQMQTLTSSHWLLN